MPELYKRKPNIKCFVCGKEIYRRPVELEKSGQKAFCSSVCYGKANRKETPCLVCGAMILSQFNKKTCSRTCANINRTGLKYKASSPKDKVKTGLALKNRLLEERGHNCERCRYNKVEILQVHHKDLDRGNNDLSNLELVCPNCHYEEHFLFGKRKLKNK
ncbi:MAG: HNH endonuclease signature motif containing protein [Candidatus Paceibacterota bacterium]